MPAATPFLGFWDYVVIGLSLVLSSVYGLVHSNLRFRKQTDKSGHEDIASRNSTHEYLLAGRKMGMLPVAFSYFATVASTGVVIGYPTEVYSFGFQVVLIIVSIVPCTLVMNRIFLPVYKSLHSASVYEYLEIRFGKTLRNVITVFVVLQAIALSSANVYGPSTVLSRVTGLNTWIIVGGLSGLCIIYTTFGGIRAVIFADVIQAVLIFVSVGLLLIGGVAHVGRLSTVIELNRLTRRLDIFNFDFGMSVRQTFWTAVIGYFFTFMALTSTSQFAMQRFMATPNLQVARRANIVGNCMYMLVLFLSQSLGLVAYATFHGCDPLKEGSIDNMDQLLPAFVMKVLPYPALPGFIFTGILCSSLSTLSSVYNSTATVIYLSFIKPRWPFMAADTATTVCKILAFTVGVLSVCGVFLVELFPNVVQSMISVFAAVSAPLLGLLLVGIFFPRANTTAASSSFLVSVLMMVWVIGGSLIRKTKLDTKPLTVDGCTFAGNVTMVTSVFSNVTLHEPDDVLQISYFPLSSVSFMWYSAMGTLATILLFAVTSIFVGGVRGEVDDGVVKSIPEAVHRLHKKIPARWRRFLLCDVFALVPEQGKFTRNDDEQRSDIAIGLMSFGNDECSRINIYAK